MARGKRRTSRGCYPANLGKTDFRKESWDSGSGAAADGPSDHWRLQRGTRGPWSAFEEELKTELRQLFEVVSWKGSRGRKWELQADVESGEVCEFFSLDGKNNGMFICL